MKKIKYIILSVLSFTILVGCLDEYKDLNTDPELLGTTDPRYAFTGAVENWNNRSRADLMNKYAGVMQYMQYIVFYNGAESGRYVSPSATTGKPSPYVPYYNEYYEYIGLRLNYLINTVIPANEEKDRYQDLAAISRILETYQAWLMFDVYGAAPYSEAFKTASEGIRTPRYDLYQKDLSGKELYKVFDEKIKEQVSVLQSTGSEQYDLGNNDYFYKGDKAKWIKFGNTVRIKMAQRLEKADNAFYNSVIQEALSNSGGIISGLEESCIYNHPNEHNNNTDDTHILTYQYGVSRALVDFLSEYDDPRLPILVRRNGFGFGNNNSTNDNWADSLKLYFPNYETEFAQWTGRYVGMSANPDSASSDWSKYTYRELLYTSDGTEKTMSIRHVSQIESRFYVKNGGNVGTQVTSRDKEDETYHVSTDDFSLFTPLITYPEVCFMMAEIALKSGSSQGGKNADTWYREGIRASMKQYQAWAEKMKVPSAMNSGSDNYQPITDAKIDAYLAKPEFQTATLEKIVSQQWVNLFMRPEEAWATWKRTGYPAFKNQPEPQNGCAYLESVTTAGNSLIIPRRCNLGAPNNENIDNYNDAVNQLKTDSNYGNSHEDTNGRIWWDKP